MAEETVGTYALISLADVKAYLDITDIKQDEQIRKLINDVSAIIEGYCDRSILARDYTEDYDGTGTPELFLKQYPVNTLTSIYIDSNREFGSSTLVDSLDYTFYPDEGIVRMISLTGSYFTSGVRNVRVTYNAGYSTTPYEIRSIVLEIIVKKLKKYSGRQVGVTSESSGNSSISIELADLSKEHKMILDSKFRRVDFGQGG